MTAPDPFPAPAVTPERELTAPVSLTLPNGRLNPAASGFARSPLVDTCLLYTSPSPRDRQKSRMPSSA